MVVVELGKQEYDEVLSQFPNVEFAFAYGSGAVAQSGYDYKGDPSTLPMIDMIFVVQDTKQWHRDNLSRNPSHYSPLFPLKYLPISAMSYLTDAVGAAVWFNVDVTIPIQKIPRKIKYGIISYNELISDLKDWKYLYVSGRLHKPVVVMKDHSEVRALIRRNHQNALAMSLLLLPRSFSEPTLYRTIASLSYTGDPRMGIAENPNKIDNLVGPKLPEYRALYQDVMQVVSPIASISIANASPAEGGGVVITQDVSIEVKKSLLQLLPTQFKTVEHEVHNMHSVKTVLHNIVNKAATGQSAKGLITAGLGRSTIYLIEKVKKAFKR